MAKTEDKQAGGSEGKGRFMSLRLRVHVGEIRAIGPGKADLLERVKETESLSEAARRMEMSYRRAWGLVQEMNACFIGPLVEAEVGGARGGKTVLTELGAEVLEIYREAEKSAEKAAAGKLEKMKGKLRGKRD